MLDTEANGIKRLRRVLLDTDPVEDKALISTINDGIDLLTRA